LHVAGLSQQRLRGGETNFVTLGLKISGEPGDAILFHNCGAAASPDRATLHAGLPATRGEKWLPSNWYHEKTFGADATGVNNA
jgi:prolyl 4-hydroxylase